MLLGRARRRRRPHLLRRPRRRRARLPARDPADHAPRPAPGDHARGADLRGRRARVVPRRSRCCSGSRRSSSVVLVVTVVVGRRHSPTSAPKTASCTRRRRSTRRGVRCSASTSCQLGPTTSNYLLVHDGTFGSGIRRFNGNPASLAGYYAKDPRAIPFDVLGTPPAARAHHRIGRRQRDPRVARVPRARHRGGRAQPGDGLAAHQPLRRLHRSPRRSSPTCTCTTATAARTSRAHKTKYNLVWYVAPDSYAATNAASSGAFVLSESYLYTTEMIKTTLQHLTDNGIMVVQFGELDFQAAPNRTSRYVVTARKALAGARRQGPRTTTCSSPRSSRKARATSRRSS